PFNVSDANPKDVEFLQVLLSKFLPDADKATVYRTGQEPRRLRLGDLPATSQFMESFVSEKLPKEPLYDMPSWLANNMPQYDAQPKSPHYHWSSWMRQHLSLDLQRLYAAFAEYMASEPHRLGIVRQANFELARLWDWQHRRVAAGLSPDL
uniref:mS111 n=1 Tax=Polytomella magna TaxID=353565 RepID=UPI002240E3C5|nr:Chain Yf, mS111 [Polytomella magna]8APN_Yf Chain Yf, mS111 [Polytomella magna]8APO_Yf Chain Yf, mS111 [Polytomella magna]